MQKAKLGETHEAFGEGGGSSLPEKPVTESLRDRDKAWRCWVVLGTLVMSLSWYLTNESFGSLTFWILEHEVSVDFCLALSCTFEWVYCLLCLKRNEMGQVRLWWTGESVTNRWKLRLGSSWWVTCRTMYQVARSSRISKNTWTTSYLHVKSLFLILEDESRKLSLHPSI